MKNHPANDWKFSDDAEQQFVYWFHELYGKFSLRSEWFYGDCDVEDEKTRKDLMYKWAHAAFVSGYECGRNTSISNQNL